MATLIRQQAGHVGSLLTRAGGGRYTPRFGRGQISGCGAAQMRLRNGGGQVFPSGKAMDGTATAEPRGRYNRSTHLVLSISGVNLAHLCDGDAI